MKVVFASTSVIFGVMAAVLVFTSYYDTPPLPIILFSFLGIIAGIINMKEVKSLSVIGIILSVVSLLYLAYLFIQLAG